MARIAANSERVYRIQRWRGVNEAPEGDASLELGEAASMRNFKVTAAGALQKRGGSANAAGLLSGYTTALAEDTATLYAELGTSYLELELYPGISADDMGELSLTGDAETVTLATAGAHEGWYLTNGGRFYRFEGVAVPEAGRYEWEFRRVTAAANTTDTAVRGLWSGFVAGQEVLCAACNGYLWQLARSEAGAWSKTACGAIDTGEDVHMFGFQDRLYLLNGSEYKVWDGTALTDVGGYRPLVAVSVPPAATRSVPFAEVSACPYIMGRICRTASVAFEAPSPPTISVPPPEMPASPVFAPSSVGMESVPEAEDNGAADAEDVSDDKE